MMGSRLKRHQSASVPPVPQHDDSSLPPSPRLRNQLPLFRPPSPSSSSFPASSGRGATSQSLPSVPTTVSYDDDSKSRLGPVSEAGTAAAGTGAGEPGRSEAASVDDVPLSEKTVLAITSFMSKIGCCYYDPIQRKLFLIEDAIDSANFDLAVNIIDQVSPHVTLVSNRADETLIEGIKAKLREFPSEFAHTCEVRPNRDFTASQGRAFLLDLPVMSGIDEASSDCGNIPSGRDGEDDPDVVDVAQEGLRDAYNFMRLRNKNRPVRTQADNFLNTLRLGSSVTMGCEKSLEAVACLFSYLTRKRNAGELAGEDGMLDIISIEMVRLDKTMLINKDALHSLQIFEDESHANVHQERKKEGLSLYGMLQRTKTPMGRALLKRWMQQPSLDLGIISARHDAVECFSRTENNHISSSLQKHISVKNISRALQNMKNNINPVQQWEAVLYFLKGCITIRELIGELSGGKEVEILKNLFESFDPQQFDDLLYEIEEKIDWEKSKETHHVSIRPGIDGKLDDNRRFYDGLPSLLTSVAEHICQEVDSASCAALSVVYFPQLGYLCAVPLPKEVVDEDGTVIAPALQPPGWTMQFRTETSVYWKCRQMADMDEHIGDLYGFILDREVDLVHEMYMRVVALQDTLYHVGEVIAELDCLLAFADAAKQFDWTRPVMTESNIVRIDNGKHPLVDLLVDHFVPNDAHFVGGRGMTLARLRELEEKPDVRSLVRKEREERERRRQEQEKKRREGRMGDDVTDLNDFDEILNQEDEDEEDLLSPDDSVLILTGANASGKSVFLKMVAITVYMAHIGCFVPASQAIIGLTDKIMTRVSTRESVSRGTSAFMIDLQQVSFMLRNCTNRSLLIIDEFGKGTSSSDGAGLFVGLIKHLVTLGQDVPRCLLATHFHEIFFNDFIKKGMPLGLAHMELIVDKELASADSGANQKKLINNERIIGVTPLFKLAPGLCLKSYAFHCAESYGISQHIVERAMQVSQALAEFNLLEILDTDMTAAEAQKVQDAENLVRRALEMDWDDEHSTTMWKLAKVVQGQYHEGLEVEDENVLRIR